MPYAGTGTATRIFQGRGDGRRAWLDYRSIYEIPVPVPQAPRAQLESGGADRVLLVLVLYSITKRAVDFRSHGGDFASSVRAGYWILDGQSTEHGPVSVRRARYYTVEVEAPGQPHTLELYREVGFDERTERIIPARYNIKMPFVLCPILGDRRNAVKRKSVYVSILFSNIFASPSSHLARGGLLNIDDNGNFSKVLVVNLVLKRVSKLVQSKAVTDDWPDRSSVQKINHGLCANRQKRRGAFAG
jgi:hypothetical protein